MTNSETWGTGGRQPRKRPTKFEIQTPKKTKYSKVTVMLVKQNRRKAPFSTVSGDRACACSWGRWRDGEGADGVEVGRTEELLHCYLYRSRGHLPCRTLMVQRAARALGGREGCGSVEGRSGRGVAWVMARRASVAC